ncbi:MAG: Hpt domain-containing protein [Planctomycetota bacterium]|jgi:HPt (histidine-containing phosphotransfer) domain-containing protein
MEENGKTSDFSSYKKIQRETDSRRALLELTGEYLHDLPRQLNEVMLMLEAKDYAAIKHHAHRAKGTSGTFLLDSISKNFAELELLAERRNSEAIVEIVGKISSIVELETEKLNPPTTSSSNNSEGNTNG